MAPPGAAGCVGSCGRLRQIRLKSSDDRAWPHSGCSVSSTFVGLDVKNSVCPPRLVAQRATVDRKLNFDTSRFQMEGRVIDPHIKNQILALFWTFGRRIYDAGCQITSH